SRLAFGAHDRRCRRSTAVAHLLLHALGADADERPVVPAHRAGRSAALATRYAGRGADRFCSADGPGWESLEQEVCHEDASTTNLHDTASLLGSSGLASRFAAPDRLYLSGSDHGSDSLCADHDCGLRL